jgi:hypothetical protein
VTAGKEAAQTDKSVTEAEAVRECNGGGRREFGRDDGGETCGGIVVRGVVRARLWWPLGCFIFLLFVFGLLVLGLLVTLAFCRWGFRLGLVFETFDDGQRRGIERAQPSFV